MSENPLHFPPGFIWGTATAAAQIEGAATAEGKGESVWDRFAAAGKILNGDTPARACDHFHRFSEDFAIMRDLGLSHYRLSLAWTRIIPDGDGVINQRGIDFYNRLFDSMAEHGITPWVTLFHWDLPQSLEDRFGGWRSRKTVDAFARYADTVVKAFGQRVNHWFTLNEIVAFTRNAYGIGRNAPALQLDDATVNQTYHHALVCHGHGVRAVREYGAKGSVVGLVDNPRIPIPLRTDSKADIDAARAVFIEDNIRVQEPLNRGAYTETYLNTVGRRNAPQVQQGDFELICAPTDFLGLNVYAGFFVRAGADGKPQRLPFSPSFPKTDSDWYHITPQAIYWCPRLIADIYGSRPFYIAESGCGYSDETVQDGEVIDLHRQVLLRSYFNEMHRSIADGIDLEGYFLWSFMDNFEWGVGYSVRFGIVHTDYETLRRTPKLSARWYADVVRNNALI